MNRLVEILAVTAGLAAFAAIPAQAQTGWGSLGLYGGFTRGGELAADNETGPDFSVGDDLTGGASLEFWLGESRRFGLRFDASYTKSEFDPAISGVSDDNNDVQMFMGDANLMFRLREPEPGKTFIPYLTAGAGGVRWEVEDQLIGQYPQHDVNVRDDQGEFAWTFGIGSDFFLNENVSLRLEVKDYWYADGPYHHVSVDEDFAGGHNVQARAGLNFFWGNRDPVPEPGFIREEPEPEPAPMPEPEPEPVTETISVCVVGDAGALETVTAIRYVDTDRMVVDRDGVEVDFEDAYPAAGPEYVGAATWYLNDEPMSVTLTEEDMGGDLDDELDDAAEVLTDDEDADIARLDFVRFGNPSSMDAGQMVFVGSVEGTPIYVAESDLGTMLPRIREALTDEDDLEVILRDDAELARDFTELETFYVAVEPGCVFQPISLTTYVRATRG